MPQMDKEIFIEYFVSVMFILIQIFGVEFVTSSFFRVNTRFFVFSVLEIRKNFLNNEINNMKNLFNVNKQNILSFFPFVFLMSNVSDWQIGFQHAASPIMEGIISFHHDLMFVIIIISIFVFYILGRCIVKYGYTTKISDKKPIVVTHATILEIVWTIIPAIILLFVSIPSFSLSYSMDEEESFFLTVKVIGSQWYWTYEMLDTSSFLSKLIDNNLLDSNEFSNFIDKDMVFNYDSYMLSNDQIQYKKHRLLRVDNKLYLPTNLTIRLLITSNDVLHCWAVPALGVKLDACPGRLNQLFVFIKRPGYYYGQCSEICGINHGFMPINVIGLQKLINQNFVAIESAIFFYLFYLKNSYKK